MFLIIYICSSLYKMERVIKDIKQYSMIETKKRLRRLNLETSVMSNYTIHKDDKRKELYRKRHHRDNIDDAMSAGSLSWYLLWNKPTLNDSIKDYERRFNIEYICL